MWTIAFFVGLILGGLVFAAGYGRVLLYNLFLRSLLVTLGSALTIIAARKATNIFISPASRNLEGSPQLSEADLEEASGAAEPSGNSGSPGEADDETLEADQTAEELEDDTDIGELADMVSDTMSEEDEEA